MSKDRETRFGRAAGCKARGYRLHVLYNAGGAVIAWLLAPMSHGGCVDWNWSQGVWKNTCA